MTGMVSLGCNEQDAYIGTTTGATKSETKCGLFFGGNPNKTIIIELSGALSGLINRVSVIVTKLL